MNYCSIKMEKSDRVGSMFVFLFRKTFFQSVQLSKLSVVWEVFPLNYIFNYITEKMQRLFLESFYNFKEVNPANIYSFKDSNRNTLSN